MEKNEEKKLQLDDLKLESFMVTLNEEDLRQIQGGGTYGPSCSATGTFNCHAICDNQTP